MKLNLDPLLGLTGLILDKTLGSNRKANTIAALSELRRQSKRLQGVEALEKLREALGEDMTIRQLDEELKIRGYRS